MSNLQERMETKELNSTKKYNTTINDTDNNEYDNRKQNNFNVYTTRNSQKNNFMNQINSDKSFSRITDRYNVEKKNKMTFKSTQKERKKNLSVMTMDIENDNFSKKYNK